jgi:ABC-type sugar transport system ATPase subunit
MTPTPRLYPLWRHLHDEHGLVLVESELEEVLDVCKRIALRDAPVEVGPPEEVTE